MLLIRLAILLVPFWPFKRFLLRKLFGYSLAPSARIGYSYIFPRRLRMAAGAKIGHGNVCKGIELLSMGSHASIGRLNWITGFPRRTNTKHFELQPARRPRLVIARHSAITNRHIIDCTDRVIIGEFSTIAGFRSQLLTHSIDLVESRQKACPILIGKRCFVGTSVVILPGAQIPGYSVLAAGCVVATPLVKEYALYAGVPAKYIKQMPADNKYFARETGFVD